MIGQDRSRAAGRSGAPPRLAGPVLSALLLSAPALVHLVPAAATALELDRTALAAGEWWRILTCHWTHWSLDHLAWDLAAFGILAAIGWSVSAPRMLATLALSAVSIPAGVWIALPAMERYRGLSGLDSALFAFVACTIARRELEAGRRAMALAVGAVVAGFVAKIGYELATGATVFADSSSFVPVPLAHVIGAACGLLTAAPIGPVRTQRREVATAA